MEESESKGHIDEKLIKEIREEFARLTVKDFLSQTVLTLSTLAYQKMGVPDASAPYKDLDQAKLAIDACASLLKTLEPGLEPKERDALREVLSKVQIEFVGKGK